MIAKFQEQPEDLKNADAHLIPLEFKGYKEPTAQIKEFFTSCIESKEKENNDFKTKPGKRVSLLGHDLHGAEVKIPEYKGRNLFLCKV